MADAKYQNVKNELKNGTLLGGGVWIDDKPIKAVKAISFTAAMLQGTEVTMTIIASDVSCEAQAAVAKD
jgi:hypothetical protein